VREVGRILLPLSTELRSDRWKRWEKKSVIIYYNLVDSRFQNYENLCHSGPSSFAPPPYFTIHSSLLPSLFRSASKNPVLEDCACK